MYNLKIYKLLNDILKFVMPFFNTFILIMIYELLPYSKKKFQIYKSTLDVILKRVSQMGNLNRRMSSYYHIFKSLPKI